MKSLNRVAGKACPDARVTINSYTDNTGGEGVNIPLSAQRAKMIADYLVARGVAGDHIATVGSRFGESDRQQRHTRGRARKSSRRDRGQLGEPSMDFVIQWSFSCWRSWESAVAWSLVVTLSIKRASRDENCGGAQCSETGAQ